MNPCQISGTITHIEIHPTYHYTYATLQLSHNHQTREFVAAFPNRDMSLLGGRRTIIAGDSVEALSVGKELTATLQYDEGVPYLADILIGGSADRLSCANTFTETLQETVYYPVIATYRYGKLCHDGFCFSSGIMRGVIHVIAIGVLLTLGVMAYRKSRRSRSSCDTLV